MEPVIFATDFGNESKAALQWAATEAKSRQTTLVMLHCVEVAHDRDRWSYFVERTGYQADQFRTEALGRLTEWFMVGSTAMQVLRGAERPIVTVSERGSEE